MKINGFWLKRFKTTLVFWPFPKQMNHVQSNQMTFFSRNGSNSSHVSTTTLWQKGILTSNDSYFWLPVFATKSIFLYWSAFYFHLEMRPNVANWLWRQKIGSAQVFPDLPRSCYLHVRVHSYRWVVTSYSDPSFDILFLFFLSPACNGTSHSQ